LKDKVVIITGGSSGIGKACAKKFAESGAKVIITGRDQNKLDQASHDLKISELLTIQADSSLEMDNQRIVEKTMECFGRIDILINNAGISMRALFQDLQLDVFRKVMDINFYGSVYATKYCLPHILKSHGAIVAISSVNGFRGTPARTAYTASKYAMNGFMESLRTEVMHQGVHVMVVCPGFTASNIRHTALKADGSIQGESPRDEEKLMAPEEVALEIIKGLKKKKRDVILTGQGKLVNFLNKWIPGTMDQLVYKHMAKEKDSPFK
jgi:short-subunit dehydrogenase